MEKSHEIRIDNVKEAIRNFNSTYRLAIIFAFALLILADKNIDTGSHLKVPFFDQDTTIAIAAMIDFAAFVFCGLQLIIPYCSLQKNLDEIKVKSRADYLALVDSPSWITSSNIIIKIILLLVFPMILYAVTNEIQPEIPCLINLIVSIIGSLPYIILLMYMLLQEEINRLIRRLKRKYAKGTIRD